MSEMTESPFYTERIPCCVCGATGKVPKMIWWSKDCSVCEGTGKRVILLAKNLSPADKAMVMTSAITGTFRPRDPLSLDEILGFRLY